MSEMKYTSDVVEKSGLSFQPGAGDIKSFKGWQGRVLWGKEVVTTTEIYVGGLSVKPRAAMKAGRLRSQYQRYLDHYGNRYEIVLREAREAKQRAHKESIERRKAVRAAAPDLWRALADVLDEFAALCTNTRKMEAWLQLVETHRQGVTEIEEARMLSKETD